MPYISIYGKCSDRFVMSLHNDTNSQHGEDYEGYVVSDIGIGGGDDIAMEIDIETGKIRGWKPLTVSQVLESMGQD